METSAREREALAQWVSAHPTDVLEGHARASFPELTDALSPFAMARAAPRRWRPETSSVEAAALERRLGGFLDVLKTPTPSGFERWLCVVAGDLLGAPINLRAGLAKTSADQAGAVVVFAPPSLVSKQLSRVAAWLPISVSADPLGAASVAMLAITNAHPFADGNGRTSRVLFNAVLRAAGSPRGLYIPLYDFAAYSRMGFEIAVRRAELEQDWAGLAAHMSAVVSLIRREGWRTPEL